MADDRTDHSDLRDDHIKSIVDIAAGVFLAAISLFLLFWVFPNYIVSSTVKNDIGPEFFPKLAAWAVLGLSALLIVSRIAQFRPSEGGMKGSIILFEFGLWLVVSILSVLGMLYVGFLFVSPLIILGGALACGYRNWLVIVLITIAIPLIIDQATWLIFTVDLP